MLFIAIAYIAGLLLLSTTPLFCQDSAAPVKILTGRARDRNGAPASAATICIRDAKHEPVEETGSCVVSGADGRFRLHLRRERALAYVVTLDYRTGTNREFALVDVPSLVLFADENAGRLSNGEIEVDLKTQEISSVNPTESSTQTAFVFEICPLAAEAPCQRTEAVFDYPLNRRLELPTPATDFTIEIKFEGRDDMGRWRATVHNVKQRKLLRVEFWTGFTAIRQL